MIQCLQRAARPVVCLALLSASTWSFGAAGVPQAAVPQITQAVNNKQRITLKGNVRPMPRRARDLGAVGANTPASRVLLLLKRPAVQEAALQQFIAEAHTPGSASYRHWLTPAQLGSQFGPADSDVQAVVIWLQSQGFAIAKVSQAKNTIEFSGTAGQIEKAFATKIHSFQVDGVNHISNVTDPQIPAALAPVIAGISPLNDFRPKPMHTTPQARTLVAAPTSANPRAMTSVPRNAQSASAAPNYTRPNYTDNTGSGLLIVTPADFATIYNTPNQTLNKNYAAAKNLNGTGVTIGIAGDSNVDDLSSPTSNVNNYRKLFGLPALSANSKVVIDGNDPGTGGDDEVEALLDLEVASAVAPNADLMFYTAQDTTFQSGLILAIQRALDDNAIHILNVSFGGCEAYQGQGGNQQILNFWEQAAAQGISVTVSSGDSGSAGCDNSNTEFAAAQGLQVNGFASTPFNIAVGGTDFNQDANNIAQYWSTTNSTIGGSALKFIPESPWNDSAATNGPLSANVPFPDQNGNTNITGAGSGVSGCLNPTTVDSNGNVSGCTGAYAKPSWQNSFGPSNARELPDVSLFASNGAYGSIWFLCASGLGGDQPTDQDCTTPPAGSIVDGTYTSYQVVGGTSASSPAFAGVLALVVQQLQSATPNVRLGQADYILYPLSKQHAAAFHDVITGNNSVVCTAGTPNCAANGFLTGYDAAAGYDLATGLGSVDATQLVQNWASVVLKSSTTALTLSPVTITHGKPVSVNVTVSGTGGTPSGDVALVANTSPAAAAVQFDVPSPSVLPLTNGTATDNNYIYLPGGSYNVTANYGGDGTFASSVSTPIAVTVSPEASSLVLTVQDISLSNEGSNVTSVPYGTYVTVSAQAFSTAQLNDPAATYALQSTGTVTFSTTPAFAPLNQVVNINSNGFAEIPGQLSLAYPPATYNISATYSGDPSFGKSSTTGTFTITKADVAITSANGSTSGTLVVTVARTVAAAFDNLFTNSGLQLPTGTVTVTDSSGAPVGSGALAVVMVNTPQGQVPEAQATITLTGAAATIHYPGDTNYNGGTATGGGGGAGSFTLSASPSTITVPDGGSNTTKMNVTPAGGFTGTVNLTCAVSGGTTLQPTCSLAQPSVTISGATAVTDTLTVTTVSSGSAIGMPSNSARDTWYAAGGTALAGILLFGLPGRRRVWQRMLSLMLLIIAVGVVGCGGDGSKSTPAGSYTVTVTATSGSATQTSTVTATVQ